MEPVFAENFDLDNIVTPVDVNKLVQALQEVNYEKTEIEYLKKGFTEGFDIGYKGSKMRQSKAKNLPLSVGSPIELWNNIIKEVKERRVAGTF